jgi:hypothetical protein
MELYKTLYLNCEDTGEISNFDNNVIRINKRFNMGHRPLMGLICPHFYNSQILFLDKIISEPYKLTICLYKGLFDKKVKPSNKSTIGDTLIFFLNNLLPPDNGMIVSIYESETMENKIKIDEHFKYFVPFKEEMKWVGDGDYITLHDIEDGVSDIRKDTLKKSFPKHLETIKNIDDISIYPVKRINYKMTEEEMFSLLKHTKFHLTYPGATYFSAGLINCPTIGIYIEKQVIKIRNWLSKDREIITIEETVHERVSTMQDRGIFHAYGWDDRNDKSIKMQRQNYLKHVTNDELVCYLKGYADYK